MIGFPIYFCHFFNAVFGGGNPERQHFVDRLNNYKTFQPKIIQKDLFSNELKIK